MPDNPLHDDLFIVSFPKSGTTWLNFLMANVHLKMSGSIQHVTFYNIDDFIPDIEQVRCIKENILLFPATGSSKAMRNLIRTIRRSFTWCGIPGM